MELYSTYDYLCNEPFYIDGIGYASCPTLRDIRKITYRVFSLYVNLITISLETYRELYQSDDSSAGSLYDLILLDKPQLLYGLLSLFITDKFSFQEKNRSFVIYRDKSGSTDSPPHLGQTEEAEIIGHIGSGNFETFRSELQCILGITKPEDKAPAFKNDYAKAMYESFKKNETRQKRQANDDYELDNMIKKYCTHNKVGVSILTVWDMTYYQFITMFNEYCNGRQHDFNDMMAANTFSYKKSSDYKPGDYMRKLK